MIKISEAIVVEGRDDTINLKRCVEGLMIETHGFGIKKETWELIDKAHHEKGLIVFTDPDFSGEEIRRKILEKYPEAKQAFLSRKDATKKGDIGIENAEPEAIIEALKKAKATEKEPIIEYTDKDIYDAGLSGRADSKKRREQLGKLLGIGYGNSKQILNKLNSFNISREDFNGAIQTIDN